MENGQKESRRNMAEQVPSDTGGLVDITWVAARLGVSLRMVRRLVHERRIEYIKLGGPVRFERADVERFIEEGRRPPRRNGDDPRSGADGSTGSR